MALITSVLATCLVGVIISLLVRYRKRAETGVEALRGNSNLVNLDTVSVDSQDIDNVFVAVKREALNMDNSVCQSEKLDELNLSPPHYLSMDMIHTERYGGIVSSTPNVVQSEKLHRKQFAIGAFKLAENALLESISECDSESNRVSLEAKYVIPYKHRIPSEAESATFSLEEKVVSDHSFEHFSHKDLESGCGCDCSSIETKENVTFII